jgi:hypothetical protein
LDAFTNVGHKQAGLLKIGFYTGGCCPVQFNSLFLSRERSVNGQVTFTGKPAK